MFWIGEYHRDKNASQNAGYYADSSLRNSDSSCVANLAKATILFHEKKYADALWLYVKALRLDPKAAGASARVGIGFCAYQLGDKAKAVAAFERVLGLNPSNVEALTAIALLKLDLTCVRPDESETAISAVRMFSRAAELRPTYSIAINHHANHLFWKWQADLEKSGTLISSSAHFCLANNPSSKPLSARVNLPCMLSKYKLISSHNEHVPEINNLASRSYHCDSCVLESVSTMSMEIIYNRHCGARDSSGSLLCPRAQQPRPGGHGRCIAILHTSLSALAWVCSRSIPSRPG